MRIPSRSMSVVTSVTSLAAVALCAVGVGSSAAFAAPGDNPGKNKAADIAAIERQIDNTGPSAKVLVTAHRADWRDAAENSLAAIEAAIQNGADIIELDVQLTSDGVPVLMHDTTVDRTTRQSGRVDSFTAAQITTFRLLDHMGRDADARLTDQAVPTLEEAMKLVKGRAMVNLDKGWQFREEIAQVLKTTGTENHAIVKGAPAVEEAVAFMRAHPAIRYAHILNDNNVGDAFAFPADAMPVVWEVVFNTTDDAQAQKSYLDRVAKTGRVFINTMWDSLAAGNTDEASLRQADGLGWDNLVKNYRATILQTDNVAAMDYWRDGGPLHHWERQPGANSIRVQPETDIVEALSTDTDLNRCAATTPHLSRVDVCDGSTFNHTRGALALAHTEPGETVTMRFDVKKAGTYAVLVRTGGQHADAGQIQFLWDGAPGALHNVQHTSHLGILMQDKVETRYFPKGAHTVTLKLTEGHRQYFTLDYVQLDHVKQN